MWTSLDVADSLGSSNATLAQLALSGAAEPGAVLLAEEQTTGRGRRGRGWVAPKYSSVMMSVLVRPLVEQSRWGWLPLLTALAVVDAVGALGVQAGIKWPNDVLIAEAKLAGVLCEVVQTPEGPCVVAGCGINVHQRADELPSSAATSVFAAGGVADRELLAVEYLVAWERWFERWVANDPNVHTRYVERSSTLGSEVQLDLPDGQVMHGTATSLDRNGRLVIRSDGVERAIAAADVVHLRPDHLPR